MEFNDLTDDERTDLQDQIRGLAWAFARRAAGFGGQAPTTARCCAWPTASGWPRLPT